MINDIHQNTTTRMEKGVNLLTQNLAKIRTGRAHPSLLDGIKVDYYGTNTPLSQVANVIAEDARTLVIKVWEKNMSPIVEKAILKANLGLNPNAAGDSIRIPLPPLTEDSRKSYVKQARQETENTKVAIRNIRRDAITELKNLEKQKQITEDENRKSQDKIQKLTDQYIKKIDILLSNKENSLMAI
ncbi:MAG: ribosome recycling factor [Endozoicomonadaceae bacterium]|nr:ribosome recycling factor [Endozoicomonadaceae bacterium]